MAVVPMQKVQAVIHQHDVDRFLACMQRHGVMEFTEASSDTLAELQATAPHAELLPRVQHAVQFLNPYEVKPGLLQKLREGATTSFSESQITDKIADTDATNAVVCDVQAVQVELAEKTARVQHLEEQRELLQTWQGVSNKLATIDTDTTTSFLVAKPLEMKDSVAGIVTDAFAGEIAAFGTESIESRLLVTVETVHRDQAETLLTNTGLYIVARPEGVETASVELVAVEEKLAAAKGELGIVHDQAEHMAHTHLKDLRISEEILEWEQARFATLGSGASTANTAVFNGWVMADRLSAIETELVDKNIAAAFSELELGEDEQPPVEIKNHSFFQPFEVVTRLYGMPGYKDLDPTMFLAGFFFLFFGLSLTDVGYGITLVVIAAIVLTFFKVAPAVRTFMKLLLFVGSASALLGMLFGGYLGIPMEALPQWMQAIQVFDPIGDPLPVFYLALSLGVFQIMFGLLLKIYSEARNGRLLDGIYDQAPWLFLFVVGILFVGVTTGYVSFVTTDTLIKLVYVGFVLVVLAAARKGEGLVGKLIAILAAVYNDTIGYFSDILSYSRLLALGLATTALAFAINLIAELVGGTPIVGPVLAFAILLFGHVLALVINTLGAFIHSARLQFVEFFSKFIDGTGRSFSPLTRSERHITARDE